MSNVIFCDWLCSAVVTNNAETLKSALTDITEKWYMESRIKKIDRHKCEMKMMGTVREVKLMLEVVEKTSGNFWCVIFFLTLKAVYRYSNI